MGQTSTPSVAFNFAKAHVVLIDSNQVFLKLMAGILAGFGFRKIERLGEVPSPSEFGSVAQADLVLIDPYPNEKAAFDLIRDLRLNRQGASVSAPILIVTSAVFVKLIHEMRQSGADYVVAKPFSTSVLLDRILWVANSEGRRGNLVTPRHRLVDRQRSGNVVSRLNRFLNIAGGISVEDAKRRAEHAVALMADEAMSDIEASVEQLRVKLIGLTAAPANDDKRAVLGLANNVSCIAGMFERPGLGRAAASLCELVDGLALSGGWDAPAVHLHFEALRLLRAGKLSPAQEAHLLGGLARVVARIAPPAELARQPG